MHLLNYIVLIIIVMMISCIYTISPKKTKVVNVDCRINKKSYNMPIINMFFISIIVALYSANLGVNYGLPDRINYVLDFVTRIPTYSSSIQSFTNSPIEWGYMILNLIIKIFTDNVYWLFFFVTLIYAFFNLYILNYMSKTYNLSVFLFFISLCFFYSLYLMKQSMAVTVGGIALLEYLKGNKNKYFILSIIACTFHATAIILIPTYFIYRYLEKKESYISFTIFLIIVFMTFKYIIYILSDIPLLNQFLELDQITFIGKDINIISIFKGVPFITITFFGLIYKENLKKFLKNYNFYIICSILCSISWFFTYHMYWLYRLGWYFTLPTLAFGIKICLSIKDKNARVLHFFILYMPLLIITLREVYITLK